MIGDGRVAARSLVSSRSTARRVHVVIELQARWDGRSIQVAGSAPIRRADFDISVDGLPGFRIDGSGIFEVQLALVPAGSNIEPTASTIVDNPATRTGIQDDAPCSGDSVTELPGTLTFTTYNPGGLDVWIAEPGRRAASTARRGVVGGVVS